MSINIRADELGGESATEIIKSRPRSERCMISFASDEDIQDGEQNADTKVDEPTADPMIVLNPQDLIGRTFLMN